MNFQQQWLDRLNFIDPFYGDTAELERLLDLAPTPELHAWLAKSIKENVGFKLVMENQIEPEKTFTEVSNWIGRLLAAKGSDAALAEIEGDKTAPISIRSAAAAVRKLLAENPKRNKIEEILETIEKDITTQDDIRSAARKARLTLLRKTRIYPGLG